MRKSAALRVELHVEFFSSSECSAKSQPPRLCRAIRWRATAGVACRFAGCKSLLATAEELQLARSGTDGDATTSGPNLFDDGQHVRVHLPRRSSERVERVEHRLILHGLAGSLRLQRLFLQCRDGARSVSLEYLPLMNSVSARR